MKRMLVLIAVISVFAFTAQTHASTIALNGTITETGLPGYINVGDLFEVTIITNDHQIPRPGNDLGQTRYAAFFHNLVSWDWRFLEGSTGSYTGASLGGAFSKASLSDYLVDGHYDEFSFSVIDNGFDGVISDSLGGPKFSKWNAYFRDNNGGSNNRDGNTLIEQSNNYEILRSWDNLVDIGILSFSVEGGGTEPGVKGTIDSVVIIPEPCSILLLGLGGLLLRKRKA
jgi:hypothetical protein